ncbi:hypothetical protein [Nitratireductor rhodophyticola]|uniref:NrdR family transcriptional regulator n=1 Tax=Nitratireductor rhodophyticola TaxID=2854036 RepID=UPI003BAA79EE
MSVTGLRCPGCGKKKHRTIDSRPTFGGIRRRRECLSCSYRFSTIESIGQMNSLRRPTRKKPVDGRI